MGTCLKGIMEGASSKIILQFLELAFHMQEVGIDEMKKQKNYHRGTETQRKNASKL